MQHGLDAIASERRDSWRGAGIAGDPPTGEARCRAQASRVEIGRLERRAAELEKQAEALAK